MTLDSMIRSSEQVNELAAALAKAQGSYTAPSRDKINPHFNSRYADLAAVIEAIRAATSAAGIAISQIPRIIGDSLVLVTRLSHSSGQWMEGDWPLGKTTQTPQQLGSALTYGRRYSLSAMTNIAADDDEDGNAASAPPKGKGKAPDKSDAPRLATFTPEESAAALAKMTAELGKCDSRKALVEWSTTFKDDKERLMEGDQAKLRTAFDGRQKAIKSGAAAPAEPEKAAA